ncbi:hypothetical protein ACFWMQ_02495 [Streptomyces sp. NPDC058372]|uniref:hypothetical protein n=1 Tax=unclassified Streptomyces TaxID=2593676 RepID=UPI0036633E5C
MSRRPRAAVPGQRKRLELPAPDGPELRCDGLRAERALREVTLGQMLRRIPAALGRTVRLAWSVDRR